jgi:hypothetical protein
LKRASIPATLSRLEVTMRKLILPLVVLLGPAPAWAAKLQEDTLAAWETYKRLTEARIEKELGSAQGFLVRDFLEAGEVQMILSRIRSGVFVRELKTRSEEGAKIEIPKGLVHHWYATTFVPGANVSEVLAWVQDYDRHQDYFEEVEDSRLVSRRAQVFDIFLRLRRKKVITVHYNTDHEVSYRSLGNGRAASRSEATRIAELDRPGTPREKEKPVGDDQGFLWRLNSYWRFLEEDGGVAVECESVSLSRTIPLPMRWMVEPIINDVPRESLEAALLPLRKALGKPRTQSGMPPFLIKR